MNSLHSFRTEWRSEWQMPQKRISICTSRSVGSRRGVVVEASGDVAVPAEDAFVLYIVRSSSLPVPGHAPYLTASARHPPTVQFTSRASRRIRRRVSGHPEDGH